MGVKRARRSIFCTDRSIHWKKVFGIKKHIDTFEETSAANSWLENDSGGFDMEFWLISTEHLEDSLLFRDSEDFRVGMNYVAVQTFKAGINMLAFILMSNHVHFVVEGSLAQAKSFANGFKGEFSRHIWNKYGVRELLRRKGVDVRLVPKYNEALERSIAYVQMNCVAANICIHPVEYPWGTGGTFFSLSDQGGRCLKDFSARERFRLLHTKADLPEFWKINDLGFIIPESYVSKDFVEDIFHTPKRLNYFLQNSSKAKQRLEMGEKCVPAFSDQIISAALPELCRSLFQKPSIGTLDEDQIVELLRQLRFRFASNVNQLARIVGLSYEDTAALLDRV